MTVREALLSRLGAVVDVGDGEAVTGAGTTELLKRYAVLYVMPRRVSSENVANTHDLYEWEFRVVSVGQDERQVEWVHGRTQDAMAGWTPTVTGYVLGPVETRGTSKIDRDEDRPDQTIHYGSASYVVRGSSA